MTYRYPIFLVFLITWWVYNVNLKRFRSSTARENQLLSYFTQKLIFVYTSCTIRKLEYIWNVHNCKRKKQLMIYWTANKLTGRTREMALELIKRNQSEGWFIDLRKRWIIPETQWTLGHRHLSLTLSLPLSRF